MNWKASKHDYQLAADIAKRATELYKQVEGGVTRSQESEFHRTVLMDIIACHANGNPLKLAELATAPRFDFSHDVFGIYRHLDRGTGKLRDCFLPRYSA